MPKVSVIIPAYNCAPFIARTIRSVQDQTLEDWELILVDDGSTDNSGEVVQALAKNDPRIKYIYQDNYGAPAKPKNIGIGVAKGKYIAFLDHDDEWLPEKLEKQINLFRTSKVSNLGLVFSNALIVNLVDGSTLEHKITKVSDWGAGLLERNYIFCSSGVVVQKNVFDKVGLHDERFKQGDDWDMWLRISQSFGFDFVYEPLYKFNRHPRTVTSNLGHGLKMDDYYYGLSKHLELFRKHSKEYCSRLLTMGRMCYIAGERKKGISFFSKAINVKPTDPRGYVNLAAALLGPYFYNLLIKIRKK
jgi:glycosyltransferase involved in cell wall biosynthesis